MARKKRAGKPSRIGQIRQVYKLTKDGDPNLPLILLRAFLYGVEPIDPVTFTAIPALLLGYGFYFFAE